MPVSFIVVLVTPFCTVVCRALSMAPRSQPIEITSLLFIMETRLSRRGDVPALLSNQITPSCKRSYFVWIMPSYLPLSQICTPTARLSPLHSSADVSRTGPQGWRARSQRSHSVWLDATVKVIPLLPVNHGCQSAPIRNLELNHLRTWSVWKQWSW